MDVCILQQDGERLGHRPLPARPATWLKAVAPSRDALVVAVAGLCTWSGRAQRCAQAGLPWVLGHARSRQARHGGQAPHDTSEAHQSAVRRRGGRLPQADGAPAARRAPRAVRRRRRPRRRTRAALLAPSHTPQRPYTRPARGQQLASQANRAGGAERCPAPAVPPSLAGDRALLGDEDPRRSAVARPRGQAAPPHAAPPLDGRQTVPGIGTILRLGRREEMPDLPRLPRGQAGLSDGRCVPGVQASAGTRDGTAGTTSGPAQLTWACSAAAGLG
jgi:hypothetical protein